MNLRKEERKSQHTAFGEPRDETKRTWFVSVLLHSFNQSSNLKNQLPFRTIRKERERGTNISRVLQEIKAVLSGLLGLLVVLPLEFSLSEEGGTVGTLRRRASTGGSNRGTGSSLEEQEEKTKVEVSSRRER